MNAGTICFQEKWFLGPRFPKSVMRDCVSRREGILMHNKVRPADHARRREVLTVIDTLCPFPKAHPVPAHVSEERCRRRSRKRDMYSMGICR